MSLPQPVPPSWKDLGKSSNDLLQKDYPFAGTALEIKTKTPSNVTFKVVGNRASNSSVILGDLEAKYNDKSHGLTLTNTWTTANVLKTQIEIDNQLAKGLKVDVNTSLAPSKDAAKGNKTAVLSAVYKQSGFHSRAFVDVLKGPTFTADAVLGRDGFLVGGEAAYNVTDGKISRYALAAGFNAPEYAVTVHAHNDLKSFSASYYHRVSADVEAGAKAVYDPKLTNGGVAIEVGTKTYLDSAAFVKAKINNAGVLALGYTQSLRPGLRASFGMALDTQKLNEVDPTGPVHKIGMSFVFDS
ncbi:voltage-dependent ion-selective channel [Mycena maculata]|uniref:Voltage-dependent ion-selective channel n=1 Tax=Mycena maculata TaxID=230809 RepID=A0AAD7MSA3_9AGAR|nr:voltage-dependent ion-selective channel [Mycena maculata]